MIAWPDYPAFPRPSVNFNIDVDTSTVRSKMDSGRVRQRRRFTRDIRGLSVAWKLSDEEYGLFQSIYRYGLNSGADWFTMVLPLGNGFQTYTVRFVADSYKAKYDEVMYWDVSAKLETEDESSPFSADEIAALVSIGWDVTAFELAVSELTEVTAL
jgi:hypothetical protein